MKAKIGFGVLSALAVSMMLAGCGPQEKPEALTQLETLRQSEESAKYNSDAPEAYQKCTDLTNKAVDAWQDGQQVKAKTYSALGQRQYATARALSMKKDALEREAKADAEAKTLKLQMETLEAKREGLEKNIENMKGRIATTDIANVESRIQGAMIEREKAAGVDAAVSQKATFDEAEAKLKDAVNYKGSGQRENAIKSADEARLLYTKAYELAKPEYDKKVLAAQSAERQKSLFTEAQSIVGPSYVFTDMKSTVIVVAGAFDMNKSEILPAKQDALRRIADLAKKYADATIIVEGFTQTRTKSHYEVSQRRVDATRDFLVAQGVDYKRMMTTAKGKEAPRYDEKKKENRALNDRVEISLTLP
jgi:outer membrane protein OmpA-like peptidoglycan-associated protein